MKVAIPYYEGTKFGVWNFQVKNTFTIIYIHIHNYLLYIYSLYRIVPRLIFFYLFASSVEKTHASIMIDLSVYMTAMTAVQKQTFP